MLAIGDGHTPGMVPPLLLEEPEIVIGTLTTTGHPSTEILHVTELAWFVLGGAAYVKLKLPAGSVRAGLTQPLPSRLPQSMLSSALLIGTPLECIAAPANDTSAPALTVADVGDTMIVHGPGGGVGPGVGVSVGFGDGWFWIGWFCGVIGYGPK